MTVGAHNVRVAVTRDGTTTTIDRILRYAVTSDMLQFADSFSFSIPERKQLWDVVELDSRVAIFIDDSQVFDGFIETRDADAGGMITVSGRDRSSRLIDEDAPFLRFANKRFLQLMQAMAGYLFDEVRLENTRNRRLISGPAGKKTASKEPGIFNRADIDHQVRPGEKRAQVLEQFAEAARVLIWSSADGRALIAGKPNQRQKIAHRLRYGGPQTDDKSAINVLERNYTESISERYSQVTVVGSGKGNFDNFGRSTTRRRGIAKDGPGRFGVGASFETPKRMIHVEQRLRSRSALEEAERIMAEQDASGVQLVATVPRHGLSQGRGRRPTIFAFDTTIGWTDDVLGIRDEFYVTRCLYEGEKEGSKTTLSMVPVGTELRGL